MSELIAKWMPYNSLIYVDSVINRREVVFYCEKKLKP